MANDVGTQPIVPRLAFLGVGWIGRNRMEAVLAGGEASACAVCDTAADMVESARALVPGARITESFDELLETKPDGVLIATPSAVHAQQAIRALDEGAAVFCQKPLGINATEVAAVVNAARRDNRLLGVDFSYRETRAMKAVRRLIQQGEIGRVYAVDLVFHNAYGPDKPWFYNPSLSGGGCMMDLGVHLVDILLWSLRFPRADVVSAALFADGRRLAGPGNQVETYAQATLELETGQVARLACSWRLHAGCDAIISATFHGTEGALNFFNINGSFYDFAAEMRRGTARDRLVNPPDQWGGRAALVWTKQLASKSGFDPGAETFLRVADLLDRIYASAWTGSPQ